MAEPPAPRDSGILLHVSSLPSSHLDDDALRWIDWIAAAGFNVWQVLPLVIPDSHGSPYQSESAFATNPGFLAPTDPPAVNDSAFQAYCAAEADWLEDFADFRLLKAAHGGAPWTTWAAPYRGRDAAAMARWRQQHERERIVVMQTQFRLDRAWRRIKQHANDRGVQLFGDVPIFVAHDSADTWANPEDFLLDAEGRPTHVTGVPPDYFSATGQRWGNPHYRWERMQADGFRWWCARMHRQAELYDTVRIDHFRGLSAVWMIDAECDTAIEGEWRPTPGDALLGVLRQRFPELAIVAEDLGVITDDVRALRRKYELPGMAVLQFAFDAFDDNPHKPQNITVDSVAYTGTHDNDTCVGWFSGLAPQARDFVFQTLGVPPQDDIAGLMIQTVLASRAAMAVAPMQDFLRLGSDARMNTPGVPDGNWRWKLDAALLDDDLAAAIGRVMADHDRGGRRA